MANSSKSLGVFAQVSGAEITAGTETALRNFSPDDIRQMAEAHAPVAFADDVFAIQDNGDATKQIAFQASAITTATTRTITMPDTNVDLGDIATNNAKVTNATHTGDVTGATALTIANGVVDVAMLSNGTDGELITWDASGVADTVAVGTSGHLLTSNGVGAAPTFQAEAVRLQFALSDETTDLTTGTAKLTFRMPHAMTLTEVRASVGTAPTGSVLTVDINESGSTILSTKITIDATEKTSETAATAPVISDSALADDAEITVDIDTIGSTIAGAGLKVTLIGTVA